MAYAAVLSPRPVGGQLNGFRHSANTQAVPADMKKCGHCQEIKDAVEFSADASRGDGLRGWCKACEAEARSKRYKKRKAASDCSPAKRRATESSYRGHDASMPYAALDEAYHHHDSGAMADSDRIRQDLLQAWTEEAQLHVAAARTPALAEQLALMRRAATLGTMHGFPSSSDLGASPLLANLTAGQIAQYAAAHVAQQQQLQQRSSAFSPVQQTDSQAGVQAAASLAAMEMIRQHTMASAAVGKPSAADAAAERSSPHTSDSEMSAVESLTGMKRGQLGAHSASGPCLSGPVTAAFRPRRGLAASSAADMTALDLTALNNVSGTTTGSLKTTSTGCALTAALEGAAANAARRSPSQPRGAAEPPRRIDLMRAPGSAESTEGPAPAPVAAVSASMSTAQQHALVNRILVSMGHPPLSSSTLALIMAKTGSSAAVKSESPEGSPVGRAYGASAVMIDRSHERLAAARAAERGRLDLEQDPNQQAQSVSAALAAMFGGQSAAASTQTTITTPLTVPGDKLLAGFGSADTRAVQVTRPLPLAGAAIGAADLQLSGKVMAPLVLNSPAMNSHAGQRQSERDPARWLSRVSLLLLALRASGFARALG